MPPYTKLIPNITIIKNNNYPKDSFISFVSTMLI